ncbi:MAG: glycine cleavage T C-terminal barrel domain-containing protein [Planctomycetota bacterium]|nr:glycine cleavage T C-terminal barrel domain-containing protein [Planctomycetota bacterium]
MARQSPLNQSHQQAEASFLPYGQPDAPPGSPATPEPALVVETFGELEGEYAALRKGCVILDLPHRGTLLIEGPDRRDFLNRMLTQELNNLEPLHTSSTLWLNRKGRIEADLRLLETGAHILADLDITVAASTTRSLDSFIISEDVRVTDVSERMHRLALHGPAAPKLLDALAPQQPPAAELPPGRAAMRSIAGVEVLIDRHDPTGEPGFDLWVSLEHVPHVYQHILDRGLDAPTLPGTHHGALTARHTGGFRLRPAGWHAFNIARIEAGTPLFNLDFGPSSLPAETGILDARVSFTKGCYLGQEVVARMHSLGHPKQTLVALRLSEENAQPGRDTQPITGARISSPTDPDRAAVGAVTSSTRSPMLSDAVICFAQVKWGHHTPGTSLLVETDAGELPAAVQPSLTFWKRDAR